MRILLFLMISVLTVSTFLTGCNGKGESGNTTQYDPGFEIPAGASLDDFSWTNQGSDSDVVFEDPYDVEGLWEMQIFRKPSVKEGAQKEIYWINITIDEKEHNIPAGEGAADVYAYQSFKNSEEAKAAGIQGSDTFDRLLKAIDDVDPTVKAHATMVLAGIEDTAGNWTEAKNPAPVELTGIFYPDGCLVRLDDPEGNQYGAHAFVVCGDEEHAVGAYYDKKRDPILSGAIFMTRDRK